MSWLEGAGLKTGAIAVPGAATGTVTPPKPKIDPALLAALRAEIATATADAQAAAGRAAVAAADNHRLALAMSQAASRARTADAEVATRQGHLSTLVLQAYIYAPRRPVCARRGDSRSGRCRIHFRRPAGITNVGRGDSFRSRC